MGRGTKKRSPLVMFGFVGVVLAAIIFAVWRGGDALPQAPPVGQSASPSRATNPIIGGTSNASATNQPLSQDARVEILVAEGNELVNKRDFAAAEEKYRQAVALSPEQEDLHYNLGIALARQGKADEAKKHYEKALELFPDYAEAQNNLGNLLLSQNKMDEAIALFRQAIENSPENPSFRNNLGTALARQQMIPEAIAEFQEAVRLAPDYAEARVNLANALLASGKPDEAVAQLNEALRLKPDYKPALQTLQRARDRQRALAR
jgi:tetratricopeptide (TPR) repeat protein